MKRSRYLTATDIAECCVCEQRVVFDHLRGKRRTAAIRRVMHAGTAAHAELHREALRERRDRWLAPWLWAIVARALSVVVNCIATRDE